MMIEVQAHGFAFEEWVRKTFFGGYSGGYTEGWDIPAEHNRCQEFPPEAQKLPISVKTAKFGAPIGLGDAKRQRNIDFSFVMIVGFWNQRTETEKWIEDIGLVTFTAEVWDKLWGSISHDSIEKLDSQIKEPDTDYSEARNKAKKWKREVKSPANQIVINPKIDSKTQRRIQCSLPFKVFWECVGREAKRQDFPELFGHRFPNPISSTPRSFG